MWPCASNYRWRDFPAMMGHTFTVSPEKPFLSCCCRREFCPSTEKLTDTKLPGPLTKSKTICNMKKTEWEEVVTGSLGNLGHVNRERKQVPKRFRERQIRWSHKSSSSYLFFQDIADNYVNKSQPFVTTENLICLWQNRKRTSGLVSFSSTGLKIEWVLMP